jgi:hypothetical protein
VAPAASDHADIAGSPLMVAAKDHHLYLHGPCNYSNRCQDSWYHRTQSVWWCRWLRGTTSTSACHTPGHTQVHA